MNTTNNTERRAIKGCPTFEIDVNGKVWNTVINKPMKEHINPAGFSYVIIGGKFHTVAYLMKAAFFVRDEKICIRHKDGNRANNRLDNLYTWFDGSEFLNPDGTEKKIITMEVDPKTNEVIKFWDSQREIAEDYNIDYNKLTYAITRCKEIDGHKFERYTAALDGLGLFDYSDGQHHIKIYEGGELVEEVTTLTAAREYTGDSIKVISRILDNGGESQRGYSYKWKLSTEQVEPTPKPQQKPTTPKRKKAERKVCQYSLDGELIATYNSVSEALPMTGVSQVTFYRALKNNDIVPKYNKVLGGYIWLYEGKKFTYIHQTPTKAIQRPKKRKAVCQYSLNGELLHTYNSVNEAAAANKLGQSQISHCAKGRTSSAGGCVWRYEGEPFDKYEIKTRGAKRVQQMVKNPDGTMTIIKEWESQMEAARELGIAMQSVRDWARTMGAKQRSDGYYYSYSE